MSDPRDIQSLNDVKAFVWSRKPEGLIIDTNILLLLLIGSYDKNFIERCALFQDNGKNYTIKDFELLENIVSIFRNKIIITPQIIAELSNLSITKKGAVGGGTDNTLKYLTAVINILKNAKEHHQIASCLWGMKVEVLGEYGFTDMTIYELARTKNLPVLTDELNLYLYFIQNKIPAIKFQYLQLGNARYTLLS